MVFRFMVHGSVGRMPRCVQFSLDVRIMHLCTIYHVYVLLCTCKGTRGAESFESWLSIIIVCFTAEACTGVLVVMPEV